MPEQQSQRAVAVTTAPIESPFETAIYPYGLGGLNLKDQLDQIPVGQFARMTNLTHAADRGLTVRPALTNLAQAGTLHHTVRRLHNPRTTDTRFWGIDTRVYTGLSGALASVDTGYSGDPLTLLAHRPTLSGEPWMFVADSARMRKIRADGTAVPIGLPAPVVAATAVAGALLTTRIAAFDNSDGTEAATWTPVAGFDRSNPANASNVPVIADGFGLSGSSVSLTLSPGGAQSTYCAWMGRAFTLDLSVLQGGAVAATDQDAIHIWVNMSHPQFTEEIRIYLVCSNNFDATQLPGLSGSTNNTDFYVKGFRQSDFSQAIQAQQSLVDAAETARIRALRDQSLTDRGTDFNSAQSTLGQVQVIANQNPANAQTLAAGAGAEEWIQYGVVDVPFRRGDFQRYGNTPGVDWSTITGIIVYVSSTTTGGPIAIRLDDFFLYGGSGPDDMEPGAQPFDWRYTNYDPRTGAESNPSPTMTLANKLDLVRRSAVVTPAAYGDGNIRQRFYRRGGANNNDWFFTGTNAADGGAFTDGNSDDVTSTAGTLNLDHFQPVPTVDANGTTVLAQPVPILFGPAQGILFALGDPYRPGFLYWCLPDEPDHWPAENAYEVCSPSEELMAGLMLGAQPFCFSRERLYAIYPNLSNTSIITVTTTACRRGLVSRWAWAIGLGLIFGVGKDAIFVTTGGTEEVISIEIERLFRGQTWNGYSPVDFTVPTAIRLAVHQDQLYFCYQGTDTARHTLVYHLLYKYWKAYEFAGKTIRHLTTDDDTAVAALLVGGSAGISYLADATATSDDGTAIACTVRNGTWNLGRPREDKLMGDMILDVDTDGEALTLVNRLNDETVTNGSNAISAAAGRNRFTIDAFGTTPQRARNISTEITWASLTHRPTLYFFGLSIIPEPDQTDNRVTQWDDLGHPDESYVTGITLDVDTGNQVRLVHFERDFGGTITSMFNATVQTNGRHKVKFSWPAAQANKVRIRPDDSCVPWILYRADWISVPEPPRIAGWDIHFEADGDQYYTGLDLYCDTEGLEKQIQVKVDEQILTNPYTGEIFWRVTATGRRWIHLTLPWGRGHVFHFTALDGNPGLLYRHKWYLAGEPSEQANWNQNFTIYGSRADKWLKAIIFECDTFGANKTVHVEADGAVVETITVNTNGRKVQQIALTTQHLGRVWRMFPVDGNPGRLYTAQPVFDEEPLCLDRWETQELNYDIPGFFTPIDASITLKSTTEVTLSVTVYQNQLGTAIDTQEYKIPSTNGIKDKPYVPFKARKGVLVKYLLTSRQPFWLYQEETTVTLLPWGGDQPQTTQPFGNADADRTRGMVSSAVAAERSGGGTA